MSALLDSLTDEQIAAVTAEGTRIHVSAPPGSGKTRVLARRAAWLIDQGVDPDQICCLTFTRSACTEIRSRVQEMVGPAVERVAISTFHERAIVDGPSLGNRTIATEEEEQAACDSLRIGPASRPSRDLVGVKELEKAIHFWEATAGLGTLTSRASMNVALVLQRLDEAGVIPTWHLLPILRAAQESDTVRHYEHVLCDEAQDASQAEIESAMQFSGDEGSVFAVGDLRQCIPAGQLVSTPNGPVPIERLGVGDQVVTTDRGRQIKASVGGIASSNHDWAFEFTTESGRTFQATKEHVLFAALGEPIGSYVYLMYRPDLGYRIGVTTRGVYKDHRDVIHARLHGERAERMWILHHTEDPAEAHRIEHTLAYRYQVPMDPFHPRPGSPVASDDHLSAFFGEFRDNGERVLRDFGQDFDHPVYMAKSTSRGRCAINLVLGALNGSASVHCESSVVDHGLATSLGFHGGRRGCLRFRSLSASASAAKSRAHGLATALGGYVAQTLSVPSSDRRVFAVRASGVFPTMFVPVLGDDGVLRLERVVSREKVPCRECFDIETDKGFFFVGGVAVHNSIMGWRFAEPSAWFPVTHRLTRTFRFGDAIAYEANKLNVGENIRGSDAVRSWVHYPALGDNFAHLEEMLDEPPVAIGRDRHDDTAILVRTHADADAIEAMIPGRVRHVRRDPLDSLSSPSDRIAAVVADGFVPVLTVHGAKGREFDRVFVIGPSTIAWGRASSDPEEMRVLYVAMTRARRGLVLVTGDPGPSGWRVKACGISGR